jgi:exosortase/archaeosortase family protein
MTHTSGPLALWHRQSPWLRFLLGFALFMLVFYAFYYSFLYKDFLAGPIEHLQAKLGSGILNLLGFSTTVAGDSISGNGFSVSIAVGCDGLEPLAMFVGGIVVFPMAFRLKWPGIVAGAIVLFILNLIRIAGLFLAGLYWPGAFDFLHLHGGFILFAAIAILLWMIWANWALQKTKNTSHA